MADIVLHNVGKQILRGQDHYADAGSPEIAAEIVKAVNGLPATDIPAEILKRDPEFLAMRTDRDAFEQRALASESLLSSMMKAGEMLSQALGEAGETFGFMHACMFGAEQHLRENGWFKPEVCNCQSPPTHLSNDCPVHGLDDERPF